jgi:hypothetical protein
MKALAAAAILAALAGSAASAQTQVKPVIEGKREVLRLDDLAIPKRWSTSECTVTEASDLKANSRPTLHMHIDVDYYHGEPGYLIGWPRATLALHKPAETRWAEYESFEFMLMAKMSRAIPPKTVVCLNVFCPDNSRAFNKFFTRLKLGEWIPVSVPITDIPNLQELTGIGFWISKSDYLHLDKVDFYAGDFRLVRSTELRLRALAMKTPVVYQDFGELKFEADVLGPKPEIARGLPVAVRQRDKVVLRETLPVVPGKQVLTVDISGLKLEPGDCSLAAFEDDPQRKLSAGFRLVESPWVTEDKK